MPQRILPVPAHLPPSMIDSVKHLPTDKRLILFTRHSLRVSSDGQGFASYALPLTPQGRVLARAWGSWLATNLDYCLDVDSISSPIQRCIDTALLMQEGAGVARAVAEQALLVEPGSLVTEPETVSTVFREIGALNFINRFLARQLAGTKTPQQGAWDILRLFYDHQPEPGHLLLAVSHDTLLAALLALMQGVGEIDWNDWPKMMEGVFLWFDDAPFEQAHVHFIWRGQVHARKLAAIGVQT